MTTLNDSPFLKACRREKTPYTPVWLMRQAGRYMKDYRSLREKTPFVELCKNKDLVTEITVTAQEKLGADAAIIFSDILLMVEPFGMSLDYLKGDGPSIKRVIRKPKDVEAIPEIDPSRSLGYVLDAIRQTRAALKSDVPLIGFAGAPFTLASYMIEGGASIDFSETKKIMLGDRSIWNLLMGKIAQATTKYLNAQIDAGVQAVQVFDSWVGCLTPQQYEAYVLPFSSQIFAGLKKGAPSIHFGTGTRHFLELFSSAGADVVGVDHRVRLDEAWKRIGYDKAIQGNFDPMLLSLSSHKEIEQQVKVILAQAEGRDGHVFNLGHGVLPETPVENAAALVELVHELSRK